MKTLLDNQMRFHQAAFNLQAYRQELLASNIANADTPHYKARDIDFRSALQNAIRKGGQSGVALDTTHQAHIAAGGSAGAGSFCRPRRQAADMGGFPPPYRQRSEAGPALPSLA